MKRLAWLPAVVLMLLRPAGASESASVLYDFEKDVQGWIADWGLAQPPRQENRNAARGQGALALDHHFKREQECIGVRAPFESSMDYESDPKFIGFSAWVYFPLGHEWEAQMYVATGGEWKLSWGKLYKQLKPGWHQILINRAEIADPSIVQAVGVQVKNYRLNTKTTIHLDYVEALYAGAE